MDSLTQAPVTMCFTKATLSLTASSANTLVTANTNATTLNYAIKGKFYGKAFNTALATPTTDATTAAAFLPVLANQGSVYVVGYDKDASAIIASQGSIQALDAAGKFITAPQFPAIPDTMCPFGYIVVSNISTGSAWTFGTSNWNATGVSGNVACVDVATLPGRPQVA